MIESDKTPDHWNIERIGDVVDNASIGGTPLRSEDEYWGGDIPWISSGAVSAEGKYTTSSPDEGITERGLEESSAKLWSEGTVLVAMHGRGTLGHSAIASINTSGNQSICGLKVDKTKIDNEYLYYWLQNIREPLANKGRGATASRQNLNQSLIIDTKIPVPPLDEQERIVEAVEERLERAEALQKSIESVSRLADEYQNSLLSYLLTGRDLSQEKMTDGEEWFEQIPENWDIKTLSEVGTRISSMINPESGRTYSLYSFDSVDDGSGYYEVDGENIGSRKRELNGGEVMISRLNPRINRVQKVDKGHKHPPIASGEFVVIDIEEYVSREYLYEYLRNPILQERLTNHVTGSTGSRSRVGFDFVMNSKIPIPPESTQEDIVNRIREIDFSVLAKSFQDVTDLFEEYRNSILSHTFRGKINY